ncbi:hypothetical protein CTAYLR_009012 [Chrysophaeum taylorii]|uniref:Cation efflux protein transmembrane domain-containing protein n=1 Tax=Chrysophaeum taylorii TaxID=2483200 RepID=A0AAD7UNH2_9STRA|nr:hypothetical protein CTAYLR_009012 [Chrysophaeum taylorii]
MSAVRCGRCRGEWSSNVKVLVVAIVLFTLMTMVQFVAAIVAHSGALLVDCASMLADAMSYMGNLYTECKGGKEDEAVLAHRALVSTGLSIVVLYGITIWGLSSATAVLLQRPVKDDLEATTVLIFGLIGVVVDAFTLLAFRVWGSDIKEPGFTSQGNSRVIFRMGSMGSGYSHTHTVSSLTRGESVYMNMCSALTHVLADAVRSMTAITLGVVVLTNRSLNGSVCDAYATLIVALTIILGNIPLLRRWSRAVNLFFSFGDKPVRTDTGCNPMHEHHTRRARARARGVRTAYATRWRSQGAQAKAAMPLCLDPWIYHPNYPEDCGYHLGHPRFLMCLL